VEDCIRRVIADLRTGESPDIRGELLEATLLIEKFTGLSSYRGVSSAAEATGRYAGEHHEPAEPLIGFAQRHREHPDAGSPSGRSASCTTSHFAPFS